MLLANSQELKKGPVVAIFVAYFTMWQGPLDPLLQFHPNFGLDDFTDANLLSKR